MKNKYLLYIISCILFALGATLFIFSKTGTDPLDVFCLGIQNHFNVKIGTIQSVFAIGCLVIYSKLTNWKFPPVSTVFTFFICGYLIDFFRFMGNPYVSLDFQYIYLLLGVLLCLFGSAGIIVSNVGIRAMDLVALELERKTQTPFWIYKFLFEVMLLASGYLMGGPVGIGTVAFLVVVGGFIKPVINVYEKLQLK